MPAAEPLPPGSPARLILVGGTTDNYPYSFLDDDQRLTGFAVEVFDAAAREMNVKFTRVLGTAAETADRFLAGELTVHPFFTKSQARVIKEDYSVPFVTLQMAIFTRKGESRIQSFEDLINQRLRIAVGGAGREYGRSHGISDENLVRVANNEAFRLLDAGKVDAAIFTRHVGLATIERLQLSNLVASSVALPDSLRDYRVAVVRGEAQLLAQINEGLASIRRTGEFDAIYQKWFGRFEPRRFTREEVIVYVAGALAVALAVTLWALRRQRQLRHDLSRQAAALSENRAILAEAQEFARVGHWRTLAATGQITWSDETFRIHERDPASGTPSLAELLSWVVSPSERAVWEHAARRAKEDGIAYEFDAMIEPQAGIRKTVHIRGRATRDAAGRVDGLFGTVQDITPWREAERALKSSERLLRAIYENVPYAMGVVEFRENSWRNVSLNSGAISLLELSGPPAPGFSLSESGVHESLCSFWNDLFARACARGDALSVERRDDKKNRDYIISVVPLGRSADRDRCCFFAEDVTVRKQKDAEIAQGRRLRAIGELVGGIAHEFNNLLTPILLKADLLKSEWSSEPALVGELQVIADTARRSADLTRRLLTFGRRSEVRATRFAIAPIIEGNFKLLRQTIDRRIVLHAELAPQLPTLYLNSGDVQQVILNLLLNSRDALVEKMGGPVPADWRPKITLEAASLPAATVRPLDSTKPDPPAWIRLTCLDNGTGMKADVIERVFEPFYTTKPVGQGTGLGLATVWHLVTEMGGRVEVRSTLGDGTTFDIFLPVFPPESDPTNQSLSPFSGTPVENVYVPIHRPHILVAEDETSIAQVVIHVLRLIGCEATHVADGQIAAQKLAAHPSGYDALVLDLNLPGMSGVEVLQHARKLSFNRPVIITSGRINEEAREELLALRVSTILQKPFTVDQLISALARAGMSRVPSA